MTTVATLATALHSLFTITAHALGRTSGLIRRQRDLTAQDFAQTLVFGWIDHSNASLGSFASTSPPPRSTGGWRRPPRPSSMG